jgi:hypothetical protein
LPAAAGQLHLHLVPAGLGRRVAQDLGGDIIGRHLGERLTGLASAVQVFGEGDQAFRAAYAEFKRTFEKCGDRWIPKQASSPGG